MTPKKILQHHYIYKITRTDGRYYVGRHSTMRLDDGYFGSGFVLRRSIIKHGKDAHTMSILETCSTYEQLKSREREIVNAAMLEDPLCMNLKIGGDGGWDHVNRDAEHQSRAGRIGGLIGGRMNNASATGKRTGPANMRAYNARATTEQRIQQSLKAGATQRANGTTLRGRIYMHRGDEQLLAKTQDEVQRLLDEGFVLGKRARKSRA